MPSDREVDEVAKALYSIDGRPSVWPHEADADKAVWRKSARVAIRAIDRVREKELAKVKPDPCGPFGIEYSMMPSAMSDAVERWRGMMANPFVDMHNMRAVGTQMADEIERLTELVRSHDAHIRQLGLLCHEQDDEIERLRAAPTVME